MFGVVIEVNETDLADFRLRMTALRWKVLSPRSFREFLFFEAQPYMRERVRDSFRAETAPNGVKWRSLRPATNEIRKAGGFPPVTPINRRTGDFQRYVEETFDINSGSADNSADLLMPSIRGSGLLKKKLEHAQRGGRVVPPKGAETTALFPARPVIGMTLRDQRFMELKLKFFIEDGMSRI
jgi:hypothetical protein